MTYNPDDDDRDITLRRTIQQVGHCVEEGLAVIEHNEDSRCAYDDLLQAMLLLQDHILPKIKRKMAEGR